MVTRTTRIGSVAAANIGMDDWISAMALLPVPRGTRPVFRSEQSGRGPPSRIYRRTPVFRQIRLGKNPLSVAHQ